MRLQALSHSALRSTYLSEIAEQCTKILDVADAYADFEIEAELLHVPGRGMIYQADSSGQWATPCAIPRGVEHVEAFLSK